MKAKVVRAWGVFTKRGRIVEFRATRKRAQQAARGIMGEHEVHPITIIKGKR